MSKNRHELFAAYSVRNIKMFNGMEGRGFSATLCRGGRAIASVLDEALGADFRWDWKSDTEAAVLTELCAQAPPENFEGMTIALDMDMLVSRLVDVYENKKRLERIAKKKTLFRLKGDAPDEWRTLNIVGPRATQYLATKYGGQLETVYGQGAAL
jgi:hypothetical protein